MSFHVIVTGGRRYADRDKLFDALDRLAEKCGILIITNGGATGADALSSEWADARSVRKVIFPANWRKFGNHAGILRNQEMLIRSHPHLVVAFHGGKGTAHMVKIAKAAGIPVQEVD